MRVLQISNYAYPHIGGIEQTARDILNAVKESGAEQRLFCFNGGKKNVFDELDGVPVTRCGCIAKVSSQSLSLSYKKLLKRTFAEFQPDTVIFHFPNPFAAHYLLKALKKYPACRLIVYYHLDITRQKILGKFFRGQTIRLLERAEKIVATSPDYIEGSAFLSLYKEKCTVIPSCVNAERLEPTEYSVKKCRQIREINEGKTVCFAVGRHVGYKGFDYLIKASRLLGDGFKIYIGGEGKLTKSLKKSAEGDSKIEFLGKLSDDDLRAYLSACDIYCFPSVSKNEAFGLALAEAMYCGKPAVTFTIEGSGVNFVNLKDVTGLEVERGNIGAYSEALERLAADKELRKQLGDAARERVEELLLYEKFAADVRELIK